MPLFLSIRYTVPQPTPTTMFPVERRNVRVLLNKKGEFFSHTTLKKSVMLGVVSDVLVVVTTGDFGLGFLKSKRQILGETPGSPGVDATKYCPLDEMSTEVPRSQSHIYTKVLLFHY